MKGNLFLLGIVLISGAILAICFMPQQEVPSPSSPAPVSPSMDHRTSVPVKAPRVATTPKRTLPDSSSRPAGRSTPVTIDSVEAYEAHSTYGPLPNRLKDAPIIGKLKVDQNGKLVINRGLRDVFDYFLSSAHEEGGDTAIGRIEEYIHLVLPSPAAQEAQAILNSYLNYKTQLSQLESSDNEGLDTDERNAALSKAIVERLELRRACLSAEVVDAFFEREEVNDIYTLKSLALASDTTLTEDQKQAGQDALEADLPESVRDSIDEMRSEDALNQKIQALQEAGGQEEEIFNLRAAFYGQGTAERLAARDAKRADFKKRINDYFSAKQNILDTEGLSAAEKQNALDKLAADNFSERELRRLKMLEALRNAKPNSSES